MILYVFYDSKNQTLSNPLLAPDLSTATHALSHLNPSNISDLSLHIISHLSHPLDLLLLEINPNKSLPDQLSRSAEVTPSATPQASARELSPIEKQKLTKLKKKEKRDAYTQSLKTKKLPS